MIRSKPGREDRMLIHTGHGTVSFVDLISKMAAECETTISRTKWDLSNSSLEISHGDVASLPDGVVKIVNANLPDGKTAWVLPSAQADTCVLLLYDLYQWEAHWKTFATFEGAVALCLAPTSLIPCNQKPNLHDSHGCHADRDVFSKAPKPDLKRKK